MQEMQRVYMAPVEMVPKAWPLGPEYCDLVQQTVNQVVEARSVARRLIDVVQTDEALPSSVRLKESKRQGEGGLRRFEPELKRAGVLLWDEFKVDLVAAQMAQKTPEQADLGDLTTVTQNLVAAEDAEVFQALVEAADKDHERIKPEKDEKPATPGPLCRAAHELREAGHAGLLAVAIDPAEWRKVGRAMAPQELRDLERVFADGVFLVKLAPKAHAIAVAPGGGNAKILVGQNYTVNWLRWEGPAHKFAICVSLAVDVSVGSAIQALTWPAPPKPQRR